MPPKAQVTKKTDKLNFIKIKYVCISQNTIKKVKRQPTKWNKIFVNHLSNNRLLYRIYKESLQLSDKKNNYPIWKWTKDLNRHVSKEDTQINGQPANGKMLKLLVIKKTQIKTTVRCHETPTRVTLQKRWTRAGKDVEKLEASYIAVGMWNGAATLENGLEIRSHHLML